MKTYRFQAPWDIRCRRWKTVHRNPIAIAALLVCRGGKIGRKGKVDAVLSMQNLYLMVKE